MFVATLAAEIPRKSDFRGWINNLWIPKSQSITVDIYFRLVERQSRLSYSNNNSKTVNDEESISSLSI